MYAAPHNLRRKGLCFLKLFCEAEGDTNTKRHPGSPCDHTRQNPEIVSEPQNCGWEPTKHPTPRINIIGEGIWLASTAYDLRMKAFCDDRFGGKL